MRLGEFLTRCSIWLALAGYFTGSFLLAISRGRRGIERASRLAWTLGCANLAIHFIFAFHFYHHWNHTAAHAETARQTNEVLGVNWGGGLYINYIILALWIVDAALWWAKGLEGYRRRASSLTLLWQALLAFIVFNATVVFGEGALRWIGFAASALLILTWASTAMKWSRSTTT